MNLLNFVQHIMKSPSKAIAVLDLCICLAFGLACFSIPACSFVSKLRIVTWLTTISFIVLMIVKLVFINKTISFDFISISFVVFAISSLISSILNRMLDFEMTAILMIISTLIIYLFTKHNLYLQSHLIKTLYFSTILFLLVFISSYFAELVHFNFNRLGELFGNINDVAIFLGLGSTFSIYYIFTTKKWLLIVANSLLALIFLYCEISTGTKILMLCFVIVSIVFIILFFGKKRWYMSIIIICSLFGFFAIIISLPFFSTLRERFLSMFATLFGSDYQSNVYYDSSTADRFNMFLNGVEMMLRKPLFGYGYHGFHVFSSFGKAWSHNNFSETFACYGLFGATLYFYPFVYSVIKTPFEFKKNKNCLIFIIILLFYFICMFSFAYDVQKLFSYSIGIVYAFFSKQSTIFKIKPIKLFLNFRKKTAL